MGALNDKFIVSPFSVLDTKQGYWQRRKKDWINLGIKSELGRDGVCLPTGFDINKYGVKQSQPTSIFDPVLCELMYKWFTPKNGKILDPFAGGSVRGVMASKLGYKYLGLELSGRQVEANRVQAKGIGVECEWRIGDSDKLLDNVENNKYDLIFSCPPYFDLEVYSDHPDDLSNKSYTDFLIKYNEIIKKSITKLKDDSFAIFVVGDVRDKNGMYRCFVEDTVNCFTNNGMYKYNEIILLNSIGTLPIRTSAQFKSKRKVGKCHQNVLVFFKGDVNKIEEKLGTLNLQTKFQTGLDKYFK